MHYRRDAFAKPGTLTILPTFNVAVGQRSTLSAYDVYFGAYNRYAETTPCPDFGCSYIASSNVGFNTVTFAGPARIRLWIRHDTEPGSSYYVASLRTMTGQNLAQAYSNTTTGGSLDYTVGAGTYRVVVDGSSCCGSYDLWYRF